MRTEERCSVPKRRRLGGRCHRSLRRTDASAHSHTAGGWLRASAEDPASFFPHGPCLPLLRVKLNLSSMCLLSQVRLSDTLPPRARLHRDLPEGRDCVRLACVGQEDLSPNDLCGRCVRSCMLVPEGPQVFELCRCKTFGSWN